jgi:thiol-disulfide isomerase/thioredoxin
MDLRDVAGQPAPAEGRWIVVVFISPECPLANADMPVFNALAREFAPKGFQIVGAYSDPYADLAALRQHTRDFAIAFPTIDDRGQRLMRRAGAGYTPEAVVFSGDGRMLYRGRIDDRVTDFGGGRPSAVHHDLRDVLIQLASGKPGPFPEVPGFGCALPGAPQ